MKTRVKIIVFLSTMIFVVSCILVFFMFLNTKEMQRRGKSTLRNLELDAESKVRQELQSLVSNVSNYVLVLEAEIDRNMYNAARVLYELDRLSKGTLTVKDLERVKQETGMSDLYLGDLNGVFTVSTEPESIGMSLFDIWEGYRMLVTGESDHLPSDLKVKAETGEIFKFTAIPRANNLGVLESALAANIVEDYLQRFIENNVGIRTMNLFDKDLMTLTSNSAENAMAIYTKSKKVPQGSSEIDAFFNGSTEMKITMGRENAQIYYPVIDKGRVRYVLFIDLDVTSYFAMQKLVENSTTELIRENAYLSIISLGTVLATLLIFTILISFVISKLVKKLEEAMESAKAANQAKSVFLSTVSHEIRTPMNGIMGFAELAKDSSSIPRIRHYLTKITDSTKWLLQIINDILDISKIESGKMELEKVSFDLRDVISRCQSVILPSIKDKNLDFKVIEGIPADKKLRGDPVRLYQTLINLLSNAVKFTEAGTIKLSSSIKNSNNGNMTVCFEVKDTGIGMDSEQIKKIFEPFTQADSGSTRSYEGTGLGLSITKKIVEMMGGKLKVESTPGEGSAFSFEITFEAADASDEFDNRDYKLIERPQFSGLVLVCDDNQLNQMVAREHLVRVGLEVVVAENGEEGVKRVEERIEKGEEPFDLVLMDIFMPVMDGIEAATKIIALNTGTSIVAMTANVMTDELENYRKHGMHDYVAKPFTPQELWQVLLKYLKPVGCLSIANDEQDYDELQIKLKINFAKSSQNLYSGIIEAIDLGDIKLAHRLVHALKGNAGQIGKIELQNIAIEVESLLKKGDTVSDKKMNQLKNELRRVLEELQPLLNEHETRCEAELLNAKQVSDMLEKIELMLENINPEVVNLLDDIRTIPGTEDLVNQIENYEFESAAKTLTKLKKRILG